MSRAREIEARWELLLDQHGAALRRLAASYEADPSRCDDLFQEICLAIWRALPSFRGESSERTFVFRIAHNRGSTHGLRQRNRAAFETPTLDDSAMERAPIDPGRDPEATTLALDQQRRLVAAIRRLPLGARQVLTSTLEGIPQREIAEILGISESNVAVRLHRARQRMRRELADDGRRDERT